MNRRLLRVALVGAVCSSLNPWGSPRVAAQAPASPPSLLVSAGPGLTRMLNEWSGTLGAELTVHVGGGVRIGGGATRVLRTVTGGSLRSGAPGDLRSGFGGAIVELDLDRRRRIALGVLVGGGHVTLTDPVTGTLSDADSFFMLEPRLTLVLPVSAELGIWSRASYRQCHGLSGLRLVLEGDCRGTGITFGVGYRY